MSNTYIRPKTAHTFFPLSADAIKTLYRVTCGLLNTETFTHDYSKLRQWMMNHSREGFADLRTAALCEQLSQSLENGMVNIDTDDALHQALCRFVSDRDSLVLVQKSQEINPHTHDTETAPSSNDHAVELLGDLDYAHDCLQMINKQAQSLAAVLHYVAKQGNDANTPLLNSTTMTSAIALLTDTLESIQDKAATAADSLVTSDDLLKELNALEAPETIKTPDYSLSLQGKQYWLQRNSDGEGRALHENEVNHLTATLDSWLSQ